MIVKELKDYLSQFPDDMEVIQHRRDSCYPIHRIESIISSTDEWYMEEGDIEGNEEKLIIDVSQ